MTFNLADAVAKANAEYFSERPVIDLTGSVLWARLCKVPQERYDSGETFERPRMSDDEITRRLDDRERARSMR